MWRFLSAIVLSASTAMASAAEPVSIVFDDASPPTMYQLRDGHAAGIYPAIVRSAFERMGSKADIKAQPFRRMMANLQQGTSGAGALIRTPEREAFADYSAPYYVEQLALYSATARKLHFESVADLAGHKLGVIRGWSYGKEFDAARAARLFEVEEVDSDEQNFEKLMLGRIDMAVATQLAGDILAADRRYAGITAFERQLNANTIHLVFNKKNGYGDFLKRFDAEIREMQADGEIRRIVQAEQAQALGNMALRSGR